MKFDMKLVNTLAIIQVDSEVNLLQTHLVCLRFKEKNPQVQICLITLERIAKNLELQLSNTFNEIIYIDNEEKIFQDTSTLPSESFILKKIYNTVFDHSVNLSTSFFASSIHRKINSKSKSGVSLNSNKEISVYDGHGQFLLMSTFNQDLVNIHNVDIFKKFFNLESIEAYSFKQSKTIVIEVFYNEVLTNNFWSNLIYTLAKDAQTHHIVLIGSNDNTHLVKNLCQLPVIKAYADRIKNNVGKYKTNDIYNLLKEASLFIGMNNLNLCLTSYFNTTTVCLSDIHSKPKAYNKNLYVTASTKFNEVAALCEALLSSSLNYQPNDIGYFLDLHDIGLLYNIEKSKAFDAKESLNFLYQIIWGLYFFDREINLSPLKLTEQAIKELETCIFAIDQISELYTFGISFSNRIIQDFDNMPKSYSSLQESVIKIQEIDELAESLLNKFPELRPINDLVQITKKNAYGNNLKDIANVTTFQYQNGIFLLNALSELIKQTCNNHKNTIKKNFEA